MNRKYLVLATLAGLIVCLDQLTKMYIHTQFRLGESFMVIPNYFQITYVRNPGAAFGIFAASHESFRKLFFLLLPPLAMGLIVIIMRGTPKEERGQIFALSMVFGGALGNYIDRLRFGFVVDFLDFHWQQRYVWPAFNVADIAIVSGVTILALYTLFQLKTDLKTRTA
ncbi:MAG: signal peptidase II [Bdellovibrionales bacterium]|nr:signal peptidase II [Bdellovibrionales bacterium]